MNFNPIRFAAELIQMLALLLVAAIIVIFWYPMKWTRWYP